MGSLSWFAAAVVKQFLTETLDHKWGWHRASWLMFIHLRLHALLVGCQDNETLGQKHMEPPTVAIRRSSNETKHKTAEEIKPKHIKSPSPHTDPDNTQTRRVYKTLPQGHTTTQKSPTCQSTDCLHLSMVYRRTQANSNGNSKAEAKRSRDFGFWKDAREHPSTVLPLGKCASWIWRLLPEWNDHSFLLEICCVFSPNSWSA